MKKIFLALVICTLFIGSFFVYIVYQWNRHASHDISIRINETTHAYQLYASYDRNKARKLQSYIDARLNTNHIFRNGKIDANLSLADHTNIYVKNIPGRLLIRLNRNENSAESYYRIKKLGEEIKIRLAED